MSISRNWWKHKMGKSLEEQCRCAGLPRLRVAQDQQAHRQGQPRGSEPGGLLTRGSQRPQKLLWQKTSSESGKQSSSTNAKGKRK